MLEIFKDCYVYVLYLFGILIGVRFYLLFMANWASVGIRNEKVTGSFSDVFRSRVSVVRDKDNLVKNPQILYEIFCRYSKRAMGMDWILWLVAFVASSPYIMHLVEFFLGKNIFGGISKSSSMLVAFGFISLLFALFFPMHVLRNPRCYEIERNELEKIIEKDKSASNKK